METPALSIRCRIQVVLVSCVLLTWLLPGTANAQDPRRPIFSPEAMATAATQIGVAAAIVQDPIHDWGRLRSLLGDYVMIAAEGHSARKCKLLTVDDAALTAVDLEEPGRPARRLVRDDVDQIDRWTGRRGSVVGAVTGAVFGFLGGGVAAMYIALQECGHTCAINAVMVPVTFFGAPIAGGFLGYRAGGDRRALTTVYVRP